MFRPFPVGLFGSKLGSSAPVYDYEFTLTAGTFYGTLIGYYGPGWNAGSISGQAIGGETLQGLYYDPGSQQMTVFYASSVPVLSGKNLYIDDILIGDLSSLATNSGTVVPGTSPVAFVNGVTYDIGYA